MQVVFLSRFKKDLIKMRNRSVAQKLRSVIFELENADQLKNIKNLEKLKGHKFAYRIKIHNYRLGLYYEDGVIELVRILPRKDIYKYFP